MSRFHRIVSLAVLLALGTVLAGCSSNMSNFDPTDLLDFLDTKKKLPGERKPVFPGGVPGLEPGVPKDLYKGAQQQQMDAPPPQAAAAEEPRPRPSKRGAASGAVQIAPADANVTPEEEGAPAAVAEPPKAAKPKVARRRTTAPPPDAEPAPAAPAQQSPAQAASPFPAPMPSGSFSR